MREDIHTEYYKAMAKQTPPETNIETSFRKFQKSKYVDRRCICNQNKRFYTEKCNCVVCDNKQQVCGWLKITNSDRE